MLDLKECAKDLLTETDDWESILPNVVFHRSIGRNKRQLARLVHLLKDVHANPTHGIRAFETLSVKFLSCEEYEEWLNDSRRSKKTPTHGILGDG